MGGTIVSMFHERAAKEPDRDALKVLIARSRRWQLARAASNCGAIATHSSFLGSVTLRGGLLGPIPSINELGGLS